MAVEEVRQPGNGAILFVYGTLRKGAVNEFAVRLQAAGQWLGLGKVKGRLYAIAHYPGLVLSENDEEWVEGDLYRLFQPEAMYSVLDDYEGCGVHNPLPHEFERTVVPVLLDSGKWIHASVYVYTQDVRGKHRIESGRFLLNQPLL